MASRKTSGKKKRLIRSSRQTRWAPFWVVPKILGMRRAAKVHPGRFTSRKRSWKRTRIKA
ncbi:MAG: hypothetical protein JSW73_02430 [Candidatus Woesearchaeota archaeon]|nr:MAG: hypothetical protein JSW73_02430 [Candidatus Woesearchaeota archaeon]